MLIRGDLETIALIVGVGLVVFGGYWVYHRWYCRKNPRDTDCQ